MPNLENPKSNQFAVQNFIWNDKKSKSKHSMLIADYGEEGYKDADIATKISALEVNWITRSLDDNLHHWKVIPSLLFLNVGGLKTIFHYHLKLPWYYKKRIVDNELVQTWSKVSAKEPSQAYEISTKVLWNKCMITSDSKSLFNETFIAIGMLTI